MDPQRAISELRELDRLTGGRDGARRVCWTEEWETARELLLERVAELGEVEVERDAADNLWAVLPGESDRMVVVGSHLDSVPEGGWLDGALGVFAALEVLRAHAEAPRSPALTVALVDWADEEGARFGRSLLGSSAFAGTLEPDAIRGLCDSEGTSLVDAMAAHGADVDLVALAGEDRRDRIAAYLELHIEQGPVLEAEGRSCAAVLGCNGVERHRIVFEGRGGHAGSTPMDRRADATVAAARTIVGLAEIARDHGGVCTAGRLALEPGIPTAIARRAELFVDQRHLDSSELALMLAAARELWDAAAAAEECSVGAERIWSIEPVAFDDRLIAAARDACSEAAGSTRELPSGALHDAAELARLAPTAMIFSSSTAGLSHAPQEDTPESDLEDALRAFGLLAGRVIAGEVLP